MSQKKTNYTKQLFSPGIIWVSIFLFSMAWLPLTGIYASTTIHHQPPYWFMASALSLGVLINILALQRIKFERIDRSYYWFLLPLLLSVGLLPFPYQLAPITLLIGLVISLLCRYGKFFDHITKGFVFSGLLLGTQTLIIPFFFLLFSRYHRVDLLNPVIHGLLRFTGLESSIAQDELFVRNGDKIFSFITSWDTMALYPLLTILVGGLVAIALFSNFRKRHSAYLILVLLLYMILRYTGMILAFIEIEKAQVFWQLGALFLSLLPLVFVLPRFIPLRKIANAKTFQLPSFGFSRQTVWLFVLIFIFVFSMTGFFGFHDPGIRKEGRILIDEGHSNWEWTTRKFDTEWYGEKSTYNYYCLADYLNHFYQVEHKSEKLTEKLLKNNDILIIKTPTEPFSEAELQAIKHFVKEGGGLFLIGDHTNVFGITTNLNPVAQQFGLRFGYDGQYDLSGELSVYKRPKVLPHPVVQYMPPFMFASGCMLEAPLTADNVIIGYGIKSLYLDYSRKDFFPPNAWNEETLEFGLFLQAAGVKYGKGRVLGFTDSTVWSNFYVFIPGKPELLLGCVEWLNRKNSFSGLFLRVMFLALAGIGLMGTIYFFAKLRAISLVLFSGILAIPVSVLVFENLNEMNYPVPQPQTKLVQVNFEYEHSDFELPLLHITQNRHKSVSTFYIWLQRLGYVPQVKFTFKESLQDGDAVVITNPRKDFSKSEVESFLNYVKNGGKALVLADPSEVNIPVVNQLLKPLSMSIRPVTRPNTATFYREDEDTLRFTTQNAGEVVGGKVLLFADLTPSEIQRPEYPFYDEAKKQEVHFPQGDFPEPLNQPGVVRSRPEPYLHRPQLIPKPTKEPLPRVPKPVFAVKKLGQGLVAVMACFDVFTDAQMGYSAVIPDKNMKNIYELEYWIFRDLFQLGD